MPISEDAFHHVPNLKGKIVDPDTSFYRVTRETFWGPEVFNAEPETYARNMLSHEVREASRAQTMKGRLDRDLWLFAYGSLIWDPAIHFDEVRLARLEGFQRSFCIRISLGRGTEENPALMLNLDHGGQVDGLAFRIPAEKIEQEAEIVWQREMFIAGYAPRFVQLETPQGSIEALAFAVDRTNPSYTGVMSLEQTALAINQGEGPLGTTLEYLENLMDHLDIVEIEDQAMAQLLARARELKAIEE